MEKIVNYIKENIKNNEVSIFAHNGNKFDHLFLINEMKNDKDFTFI